MKRWFRPVSPWLTALLATALVGGLHASAQWLRNQRSSKQTLLARFLKTQEELTQAGERFNSLRNLKDSDTAQFKAVFTDRALSRKSLYETALSMQEERRLLDKQLEIMTTRLEIKPSLQRIFLFRGDQPLQSYLLAYFPLRAFGGASDVLPPTVRIVSKERFAHPERGQSNEVRGHLEWTPPQVGTSVRSNALGEYVIFTNSKLILHGPPLNPEDHEKFPHVCLGLDLEAAKKLYRASFIGTRIVITAPVSVPQ